jgi:hypothetical protein
MWNCGDLEQVAADSCLIHCATTLYQNGGTVQDTIFNLQYVQIMPIRSLRHQLIPTFTDPLKSAA